MAPMIVVLVVASGAPWEPDVLRALGERADMVVLKRCVDLPDLLASATSGQAHVAVLGADVPGLDTGAVDHLAHHGVRPVAVAEQAVLDAVRERMRAIGVVTLVGDADLERLPDAVLAVAAQAAGAGEGGRRTTPPSGAPRPVGLPPAGPPAFPGHPGEPGPAAEEVHGRAIVVWGPTGAPGRTLVACSVAAELARRRRRTLLVDADPYGGAVAQMLGITDEVSGVLAASRWAVSDQLVEQFTVVQRSLGPDLSVVTGLPRAQRWPEVRSEALEQLLDLGRAVGDVVVDTGFCLEDDPAGQLGGRVSRNQLTIAAIEAADELLVVGGADPIGLSRLARGLAEVRELAPETSLRVVVNRMRPSLGWGEKDVAAMLAGFARLDSLHFLPEDRVAVDRALVAGRTLAAGGDSALVRAVAGLVDSWSPSLRQRTAGRGRRR